MISKEFFANTMNRLYEQENKILAVDKALVDLDNDFGGFGIPSASSISLDILKECLNDENNWLDYFIYELDWLNNIHDECIIEDNSKYVVIKTWEDVYDFITKNFEGVKLSKPQGTYMLYLDCEEWCRMHENMPMDELIKKGISVGVIWQDGRPFHRPYAIRMNLAVPHTLVVEAFERLKKYVFY